MPTFETLPRFERDWKNLSSQQRALFRKVVLEAFVPDLTAPDRPFRSGLRVKGVAAHSAVFEMTPDNEWPGNLQLRGRTHTGPAARHLAADRNSRHLHPAARPARHADGPSCER